MKLYFAGYSAYYEEAKKANLQNLLESYLTFRDKSSNGEFIQWHKNKGLLGKNIFLDSGAFSAWTRGISINIDEYAAFIKQYNQHLTVYGNLDVIGDAKGTEKNQRYLESKGLHPIATFHIGSPYPELVKMVKEYDYIALGGLVGVPQTRRIKHLDKCFRIIKLKAKIHGFGVGDFKLMLRYPFYSVDNTNWIMGGRTGAVYNFDKKALKLRSTWYKDKRIFDKIRKVDVYKFFDKKSKAHKNRTLENAIVFKEIENFVTRVWERRGVQWKD
jgi:hypothetical protein